MELSEKRLTHILALETQNKLLIKHNKGLLAENESIKKELKRLNPPKSVFRDGYYFKFNKVQNAWIAYKDDKLKKMAFVTIPADLF